MIPHNRPALGESEVSAAGRAIHSGWLAPGREVAAFESELAAFLGIPAENVVVTSSGTAALYLALWSLGVHGKRIGMPGYVCAALRNAAAMAGGRAVIVDNAPDSPNLAVPELNGGRCDVAVVAHMYGIPAPLEQLDAGITLIEDCAQAFGARSGGTPVGFQGALAVTSFYATKLLTSGGHGGAVYARERAPIDVIRDYLDFDCRRDERARFNFQMTDLQAAVGRAQLSRLPAFIERRQAIFERYRSTGLTLLDSPDEKQQAVRYRAVVVTEQAQALIEHLESLGVRAIVPTQEWELPSAEPLPNARSIARRSVSLPIYPALTDEQVEHIVSAVERFAA